MSLSDWLTFGEIIAVLLMPVLIGLVGAGVRIAWGMRQELTILAVRMEDLTRQQDEIDKLWTLVRDLQVEVTAVRAAGVGNAKR